MHLDRHRESVGQPLPPARERRIARPAVEAGVELDGVENLAGAFTGDIAKLTAA